MSEMPSHFKAVCPNCQVGLRIPLSYSGSNVRCKHCDHKFLVKKIEEMPAQIGHADPESNLVDRLSGQPEGPQSADAEPRTAEQQPESAGELAAIREENERLGARLKTLQHEHAGIQSERDSLLVQLEQSAATMLASDRNTKRTARNTRNCGTRSPRSVMPWEAYRPPRSWPP